MKCSNLSFVLLVVARFSAALFVPESDGLVVRQNNRFSGNRGNGQNGGNNNQTGGNNKNGGNNQNGGNNNSTTVNGGNNNSTTVNGGNNNKNGGNNNNGTNGDLTLNPSVIQNIDGQGVAAGEANSLVSDDNFINFCVGKTITNGQQNQQGSCNPTPMGDIPSVDNMPSCKFQFPPNGGNVDANTAFTVVLNTQGMQTGDFTNAAKTYFAAPQQLNNAGQIVGHNHVVIESISSLDSTQPTNPRVFAFFKGLNNVANNGQLTADVTSGLPAGTYRLSSITSAANHQGVIVPVAQRGSVDDAVYFTVGGNNNNNTGGNNNGTGNNNVTGGNNSTSGNNNVAGGNNNNSTGNNGQNGGNNGQNGGNNGGKNGRNGRRYERRFFVSH